MSNCSSEALFCLKIGLCLDAKDRQSVKILERLLLDGCVYNTWYFYRITLRY